MTHETVLDLDRRHGGSWQVGRGPGTDDEPHEARPVDGRRQHVVEQARVDGYTETIFGRRRPFPDLNSPNRVLRGNAERAALNAPIQGTAADIMKIAMIGVGADMLEQELRSRLLLQVHDELVLEVAEGERDTLEEIVERRMREAAHLRVPLEVQVGTGHDWDRAAH